MTRDDSIQYFAYTARCSRCSTLQHCVYFSSFLSYFILFILSRLRAPIRASACEGTSIRRCAYYFTIDESILTCIRSRFDAARVFSLPGIGSAPAAAAAIRFTLAYLRKRATESAEFIDRLINHNSKSKKTNGFLFCRFSFSFFFLSISGSFAARTKRMNILF